MSRSITELLPDVILEAPGVPYMVALQSLSGAVRDFLTRSEVWREWSVTFDLALNQFEVVIPNLVPDVVAPTADFDDTQKWQRMVRIAALQWVPTGAIIPFLTPAQMQFGDELWRTRTAAVPAAFTQEITSAQNVLVARISPGASVAGTDVLRARVVLTTHTYAGIGATASDDQDVVVPEFLFHQYRDVVVRGALARLLRMGGRDWTDKRQAAEYQSIFEMDVLRARSQADAEFGQPVLTVAYGGY